MSVKCIVRDFPSSTALYLSRNDIEGHKKEAYIRPIGFIRELQQSQKIQVMGSFRFLISKTLVFTDCTFMMTHAFRSDFFAVAARLKVMVHETIRNDYLQRNTALQHCCDIVLKIIYNIFPTLQRCVALKIVFANRTV